MKLIDAKFFPDPSLKEHCLKIMESRTQYVKDVIKSHLSILVYETGRENEQKLMDMDVGDQL